MKSIVVIAFGAILAASVLNDSASASGRTPPLPLPEQSFENHAACVAHLETLYAQDKATAQAQPAARGELETQQRLVRSDGVRHVDAYTSRYDVYVGLEIRVRLRELKTIRTNYSYEERSWACTGERLTGTHRTGFYQEGYAPLPDEARTETR